MPLPRVSDFGYSSLVLQHDGSVALPISKPWNAPDMEADMDKRDQSFWRSFFEATFLQDGLKRCQDIITCLGNLRRSRIVDAPPCVDEITGDPSQDASARPPRDFKVKAYQQWAFNC